MKYRGIEVTNVFDEEFCQEMVDKIIIMGYEECTYGNYFFYSEKKNQAAILIYEDGVHTVKYVFPKIEKSTADQKVECGYLNKPFVDYLFTIAVEKEWLWWLRLQDINGKELEINLVVLEGDRIYDIEEYEVMEIL